MDDGLETIETNDGHIRPTPFPEPHFEPVDVPGGSLPAVTVPIYGRGWFAYVMGALTLAGGILAVIPQTTYIGVGITTLCGGWLTWAGLDRTRKSAPGNWIDKVIELIRAILEALQKWYNKKRG